MASHRGTSTAHGAVAAERAAEWIGGDGGAGRVGERRWFLGASVVDGHEPFLGRCSDDRRRANL